MGAACLPASERAALPLKLRCRIAHLMPHKPTHLGCHVAGGPDLGACKVVAVEGLGDAQVPNFQEVILTQEDVGGLRGRKQRRATGACEGMNSCQDGPQECLISKAL